MGHRNSCLSPKDLKLYTVGHVGHNSCLSSKDLKIYSTCQRPATPAILARPAAHIHGLQVMASEVTNQHPGTYLVVLSNFGVV